ncbi:MAG: nucleotidyltransferase domain-containing protein [Candidatus Caldarchaeum sp.]|nr:nucleotidyltransferase domain-containing protein [Candidatus Caldarchaeum sp.]
MWLPRWVGEGFASLYASFGRDIFFLEDVCEKLALNSSRAHVLLTKLRKSGALIDFQRKRPRLYRLLDPRSLMLLASGKASRPPNIQGQYVQLVYDVLRVLSKSWSPSSVAVYGSVARLTATSLSDVDLLVVSDRFSGSLSSRIDGLLEVERDSDIRSELLFLKSQGIHAKLSFYPLTRSEAERLPLLFLDMVYDAAVILDDGFLDSLFSRLRSKLEIMGARRRTLRRGVWFWDLGPTAKEAEALWLS